MIAAEPDYKLLYEQSQKQLAETEQKYGLALEETRRMLQLALLDANELRRKLFGIKSDNRVKNATAEGQLDIFPLGAQDGDIQASEALTVDEVEKSNLEQDKQVEKRKKATASRPRMVFPEELPREEQVIDPKGVSEEEYKIIGEEVTEILVMVPASFKVKRIIRRKWALKDPLKSDKKGIVIAPIPSRTIQRGLLDESVLAHLLTSKFVDHLPLYRQKQIFERIGLKIPPSTLTDNTNAACKALLPIYNALKRETLANLYLQVDETRLQVLEDSKNGSSHRGYLWTYHAPVDGLVFFDYRMGRDRSGPKQILKDYTGVIQTDAYEVYQSLFANNKDVQHYYCMAHIRRKFDEAVKYDSERATWAVTTIARLYKIEKQIREAETPLTESQIVEKRMTEASPILTELKEWMIQEYPKVLPSSPIGKAMAYALPLIDSMKYYTLHGDLQLDNNLIENSIRPVALGRKNFLFAGTHDTAQNAAMVYSLFATCKKHVVNPHEWLLDTLTKLNDPNYQGKFSDLLPNRWKTPQKHMS
jgi:transposase